MTPEERAVWLVVLAVGGTVVGALVVYATHMAFCALGGACP